MSQLYLYPKLRNFYKREIEAFTELYLEKLFPVFDNIEDEAQEFSNEFYDEMMQKSWGPSLDPSDFVADAIEMGIMKYTELSMVKYDFTASSISTLYHFWEQQVRKFLYKEVRHDSQITLRNFCGSLKEIKQVFNNHGVNIESLNCWPKIHELLLLNNVIKHGEGSSCQQLLNSQPSLIKSQYRGGSYNFEIESTLLNDVLDISKDTFKVYSQSIIQFWDELSERSFSP